MNCQTACRRPAAFAYHDGNSENRQEKSFQHHEWINGDAPPAADSRPTRIESAVWWQTRCLAWDGRRKTQVVVSSTHKTPPRIMRTPPNTDSARTTGATECTHVRQRAQQAQRHIVSDRTSPLKWFAQARSGRTPCTGPMSAALSSCAYAVRRTGVPRSRAPRRASRTYQYSYRTTSCSSHMAYYLNTKVGSRSVPTICSTQRSASEAISPVASMK
jgi:hypothetical protein